MTIHKILAIEPDGLFQNFLRELLTDNFELDCVENWHDAQSYMKEAPTSCVILTDQVPDAEYPEVLSTLNKMDIPVIMVSGSSDESLALEATKLGALDYHTKESLSPRTLQSSLNHVIDLHLALQRESQRQADLAAFVATAAHDLSSPLMVIAGQAELMKMGIQDGDEPEELEAYADEIQNSCTGLLDFINKLLEHTRSAKEVELQPVNLQEIYEQAKSRLGAVIENSGGEVTATPEPLPEVFGDPTWLTQLLQNLIGNALKYSRPDTTPTVEVIVEEDQKSGEFVVCIKDNGLGIPKKYHQNIFRPLERGPLREQSGFGIGLATCQRIVERHSGRIWVESEVNVGSQFFFTLPKQS